MKTKIAATSSNQSSAQVKAKPAQSKKTATKSKGSERKTEGLVRDALPTLGYVHGIGGFSIEEQVSVIDEVKKLLRTAGKSGNGGKGSPEFIVSNNNDTDFILIVECKASTKDHCSPFCRRLLAEETVAETDDERAKRVPAFAVDGVLHYAKVLSKSFSVIAVAVSGQTQDEVEISTFLHPKGGNIARELKTKAGANIKHLIPWRDYIEHATFDPSIQKLRFDELMAFSRELHDFMREHAGLSESEKPLLVSGTLIALRNPVFAAAFGLHKPADLQAEWLNTIRKEIEQAKLPMGKTENMVQPYSAIAVHPELGKAKKDFPKGILHELVKMLNEKVWPFLSVYHDFDVVGQFYGEFLKYTGGDKKALGIVLTPRHITELFCLLARVKKDSKVLDICAGTGGFLIAAMHQMMKSAVTDKEKKRIKDDGMVGIEQQPNMFALAASNMILRGDGKANLYQGSCFDEGISNAVKKKMCDIGLINPPYSQAAADLHELEFVGKMLDLLTVGGTGIVIVPMSCAIAIHPAKARLLRKHTLQAVVSMPDELFYPVGTITCIMVFTAHKPHDSGVKTWFGYWKDDGFVKTKHRGRIDLDGRWPSIRDAWVDAFINKDDVPGMSVKKAVSAADEWCAEAYMETDYARLTSDDYGLCVKKYFLFRLVNEAEEKALSSSGPEQEDQDAEGNQ